MWGGDSIIRAPGEPPKPIVPQSRPLPKSIVVSLGLSRGETFEGSLPPSQLPRLAAVLAGESAPLQVQLGLVRDDVGNWLRGSIDGSLPLRCSRCECVYAYALQAEVGLRLVQGEEQARQVLQDADPYEVSNDRLPLAEVVEDEVLLALPMLPRCLACEAAVEALPEPEVQPKMDEASRPNPFAALLSKDLLSKK